MGLLCRILLIDGNMRFFNKKGKCLMSEFSAFVQLIVTVIAGIYFFTRLKSESENEKQFKAEYKK